MSGEWSKFLSALESKGCSFSQVCRASDRRSVIEAAGFTDPFAVAVLETEWQLHVRNLGAPDGSAQEGPAGGSTGYADSRGTPLAEERAKPQAAPLSRSLLEAYDFTRLHEAPEEVQDNVVAAEILSVAVGVGGALITATREGFVVTSYVPASMRQLCTSVVQVADAYVDLQRVQQAEHLGTSLVAMALGEVVSEVCTSYAHHVAKLDRWSRGRSMPLMGLASEIQRIGYHLVRLRQVLPTETIFSGDSRTSLSGWRILNHLHTQSERYAGSKEDVELLQLLLRRASVPYMRIMSRWVQEGVLEDSFGEFFIIENKQATRSLPTMVGGTYGTSESAASASKRLFGGAVPLFTNITSRNSTLTSMYATSDSALEDVIAFERRFTLSKGLIPNFLLMNSRVSKMVFYAGKYCCLLREYNGSLPAMPASAATLVSWTNADDLQRVVQESYDAANAAVIQLFFSPQVDLVGHLNSLKNYFFHHRGDWIVDFLDAAEELLHKSPIQVKTHSIRVLLQAAIAKSCADDQYHDQIGCSLADMGLEQYVQSALNPDAQASRSSGRLSAMKVEARRCIELVQLEADLQWPLTLLLDPLAVKHMNVVFRLLMWLRVAERKLCASWDPRDDGRAFDSRSRSLKQQMIHFLRQFQFYAVHFVVEPQWGRMMTRITQADSVFAINNALNDFFDGVELGLVLASSTRFRSLSKILDLITRFCDLGRHTPGHLNTAERSVALQAIQNSFYEALSELAVPGGADYPQLVPLFTWIDFSGFYNRNDVFRVQPSAATLVEAALMKGSAAKRDL